MKVSELIMQLESYKPDDELLVAYWDKEFAETAFDSDEGIKVSDEVWSQAIRRAEKAEFWQSCASEEITDQVMQLVREGWEEGECDKCASSYDLSSRDNRCGTCGNCDTCCTHKGKEEE
jgi:hypothetical protein